jgi:tetratricopeptide (TPR) repeat protein
MAEPEALTLLERLVTGDRTTAEMPAARRIVAACDRLPLALRIAGARLATHPGLSLAAFADRLSDARRRLDELRHADLGVRASFTASLDALSAEADGDAVTRTFRLLGLLDGPNVALPAVTALTGDSLPGTRAALERLAEVQLLTYVAEDRYGMHDLVRLYAREQAHLSLTAGERDAAWQRALHHYLANCRAASRILDAATDHRMVLGPATRTEDRAGIAFADRGEAIDWIDAERDNLLAAVRQASSAPGDGPAIAIGLAAALFRPFNMRGPYEDRVTVGRLALAAACRIDDAAAEAQTLNDLAWACHIAGHSGEAVDHLERAVTRWREAGDAKGLAHSLSNLGSLYSWQDRHDLAVASCEAGVTAFREMDDLHGEARALISLGGIYQRAGRYEDAIVANERSLALHRKTGHARGEAVACGNLAESNRLAGRTDRAIPLFEQAIDAVHEVGDRAAEAEFHWFLGDALDTVEQQGRARECRRRALAVLTDMGALSMEDAAAILRQPKPGAPEPILRTK